MDTSGAVAGQRAHVLVRPEAVHPDPPEDAVNRLAGRIDRVRYLGATCRYDFVPLAAAHQMPEPDRPVTHLLCEGPTPAADAVALRPESLLLLPEQDPIPEISLRDPSGPHVARA